MNNLLSEGQEINKIFYCLYDYDEIHIVNTLLYCKFILQLGKDEINDNLYERCEKYLEESKKYVSPEYVNKYLK